MNLPPYPNLPGYTWRPVTLDDSQAIHEMFTAIAAFDHREWVSTLDDRRRDYADEASNPATDSLLAFDERGELAALGWTLVPPEADQEYVAFLWVEVHPAHRGRGLESAILNWTETRGRQVLADKPEGPRRCMRVNCMDFVKDRIQLYEQHGFNHTRTFFIMRRDLSQPIPAPVLPEGVRLERYRPELDQALFLAVNEAFRDHWGFIPLEPQAWKLFLTGHPDFRPELTFLALTGPDDAPEIAGFSINQVRSAENEAFGRREGWIQELGTLRAWRKQGIASALLCASMQSFCEAGLTTAGLAVDAENLTGALRIYERLGFTVFRRSRTYEKKLS